MKIFINDVQTFFERPESLAVKNVKIKSWYSWRLSILSISVSLIFSAYARMSVSVCL